MTTSDDLMDSVTCERAQVTRDDAVTGRARDVMLAHPKTLPGDATLADARAFFANPKVISAIVVDGSAFVGLLDRSDLPSLEPDNSPIRTFTRRAVPTTRPDHLVADVMAELDDGGLARMVVLENDDLTLAGLLCLDLQRAGFCQG